MRFLYVMDPMEGVSPDKDTTFAFLRAAQRRGHVALHCLLRDVFVREGGPFARVRPVTVSENAPHFAFGRAAEVPIASEAHGGTAGMGVDAVFIRKDPPFDSQYLYTTLLLERARGKTLLVNDPRGLRDANEKLYPLHFPALMPRTMVACEREQILAFMNEVGGKAVIKPLDGAGGAGVLMLSAGDRNNRSMIETVTLEGRRFAMVQEYLPAVRSGDKRVLLLDGEILGGINRVAREDDLRSNIHVGGRVEAADVTPEERHVVDTIKPRLLADGLVFVGLDFIGGKLTEINVTSPTGIQEMSLHHGRDLAEDVIAWAEKNAAPRGAS